MQLGVRTVVAALFSCGEAKRKTTVGERQSEGIVKMCIGLGTGVREVLYAGYPNNF